MKLKLGVIRRREKEGEREVKWSQDSECIWAIDSNSYR